MVAWMCSFLLLAGLVFAAVHWRNDVMRIWPPSARLFAAISDLSLQQPASPHGTTK